jgi:flagellar FliL protein
MSNATAVPADAAADGTKPGSKKKLFIIAGAAVALVAGGGAYFLLGAKKDEHPVEAKAEHKVPAQYVALEPPFVVNFDPGAGAKFLQVAVQLMTRDLETAEFIKSHDPVIRNDLLLLFGNQKVEEVSSREGKDALRGAALEAVRTIIKAEGGEPEKLEAVYFTSFVMQ